MLDVALRNTERLGDLVDNLLVLVRLDSVDETVSAGSDDVDIAVGRVGGGRHRASRDRRPRPRAACDLPDRPGGGARRLRPARPGAGQPAQQRLEVHAGGRSRSTSTSRWSAARCASSITDTGIGIPAEELPQLFTRFFRASTARANSISGNGLGLAIVKSIVERHGGEVDVESEPGVGFAVHDHAARARRRRIGNRQQREDGGLSR